MSASACATSLLSAEGFAVARMVRLEAIGSVPASPLATRAFRSAASAYTYAFQCSAHMTTSPSLRLGCFGNVLTGASWGAMPEPALKTFLRATNPKLGQHDVRGLLPALGWTTDVESYPEIA